jgi:hypothetical protein
MNKKFDEQGNLCQLLVYVTNSRGGEIASKIIGHFVIDDMRFPFSALAFGRVGGHNIHLKLAKTTLEALGRKGYDPEWVQLEIQQKLIQGDIILPSELRFPGKDPL